LLAGDNTTYRVKLWEYVRRTETNTEREVQSSNIKSFLEENGKLTITYHQATAKLHVEEKWNRREKLPKILPDSTGLTLTSLVFLRSGKSNSKCVALLICRICHSHSLLIFLVPGIN
jgi:hypothetical protein